MARLLGTQNRSRPYVRNVMRATIFESDRQLKKIGKPVDRTEWGISTPTVNAYYNPHMNEIVFPAGILQPPFFDPNADDAVNYGGIGAVIGHEMTHGFDDQGRAVRRRRQPARLVDAGIGRKRTRTARKRSWRNTPPTSRSRARRSMAS